ncbi:sensor histidine kinase [Hydrogenophaga sp.]|uniref:sensor histidine kinase n=1 Tax=Hydrogenophaga sp. TaxID=1904254 RepID=UPI002729651A|nr:sensor histidine kinase [Hydrogenophaga sp.]
MTRMRWTRSLRFRLLAATLVALALALLLAGWALAGLFRQHVMRQFETSLTQQLDQLTARLEFDATGQPLIDPQGLSDPRWQKPYSGLYWQIDQISADGQARSSVLRSRSLWDTRLELHPDDLADGALHAHEGTGPQGSAVLMLERTVRPDEQPEVRWRLVVAANTQDSLLAVARFNGVLAMSLLVLGLLLVLAALAQVAVGLSPLRNLQRALARVREGQAARLQGQFPAEVQPLIDDFNGVLERNAEVVARARTQAGNLAHAIKTPLAVLGQAATQSLQTSLGDPALARLVQEQVATARRHIDWHLARSRAAAAQNLPGLRTPLAPVAAGLARVMQRVYAARALQIDVTGVPEALAFAGEEQDLQEMLGNLLDNACKWARTTVRVSAKVNEDELCVEVEDDGPGLDEAARDAVLARGVRMDEAVPGSGLGLAIVNELAQLYGGRLQLCSSSLDGLRATLTLPKTA